MSTTFYSPEYTLGDAHLRMGCIYNVSTTNTAVTVSGTIYLDHKGGQSLISASYFGICGFTKNDVMPSPSSGTYVSGTFYSSYVTPHANTTAVSTQTVASHSSWTCVYSKTFSFTRNKTTAAQSVKFIVGVTSSSSPQDFVWAGAYKTVSVPALTSYNVTYNANGGSGAPATQKKYYGQTLTLSSTKPTRTNYVFKNWNTASGGTGTTYNPGASYTANAALTLYAQWYAPYTVTYNANGGTGGPSTQTKVYNTNLTLTTSQPTRSGYAFVKWNTKSDGTGTSYNSGATYSSNANVTLYAIWAAVPSIGTLTAVRCDENGDQDDEGAYATITCTWSCVGSSAITGTITPQSGGNATSFTFGTNPSGSGTVTSIALVGSGNGMVLDTDMQYTVSVTVTCTTSGTTKTATRNVILTRAFFVMDWKAGGGGVGIGRAAPESGLEVGYAATFDDVVDVYGHLRAHGYASIYSTDMERDVSPGSSTKEKDLYFRDKNGNTFGWIGAIQAANSTNHSMRIVTQRTVNGTNKFHIVNVGIDINGNAYAGISGDGAQAAWRNALGAVNKAGDTMTGPLYVNTSSMDRDGANPSATQWGSGLTCRDKDSEQFAYFGPVRWTDGSSGACMYGYNEKSDGTQVANAINLQVAKDGTLSVSLTSPYAWRQNLLIREALCTRKLGTGGTAYAFRVGTLLIVSGTYTGCSISSTYTSTDVCEFNLATLGGGSVTNLGGYAHFSGGGPSYQGGSVNTGGWLNGNKVQVQVSAAVSSKYLRFCMVGRIS